MEFLNHSLLEGEKLQLVGGVVGFSLCQTLPSIGDDGISIVIMSLVEDNSQARHASISVKFKRSGEISIGKNRCCGAQAPQVIKGPLASVIPHDSHFLLACIFSGYQLMQRSNYLQELWNKLPVISHKPQKT